MGNQTQSGKIEKMRWILLMVILCAAMPVPSVAFAADGGTTLGETIDLLLTTQMEYVPRLISAICYLMGIVLMASGALKLKGHAENPTNVKMEAGIARMFAGACLVSLPTFVGWVIKSTQITGEVPSYIKVTPGFGS